MQDGRLGGPQVGPPDVAVGRLEPAEQRAQRTIDGGELLGQGGGVIPHHREPIGDGKDARLHGRRE